jgi:hypothetical protein
VFVSRHAAWLLASKLTRICSISLITTMGLIGDNCARCAEAAEYDNGLAGKWWRFWAEVRWRRYT